MRNRLCAILIAGGLTAAQLTVTVAQVQFWPFSPFWMFARAGDLRALRVFRLIGVERDGTRHYVSEKFSGADFPFPRGLYGAALKASNTSRLKGLMMWQSARALENGEFNASVVECLLVETSVRRGESGELAAVDRTLLGPLRCPPEAGAQ